MNTNKICVYAIAKNEEKFVDKWVDSMKEADCIVVLDTGSTDNTVELLRRRSITVVSKTIDPWRFDVARNEAMKLVPDDCNILVSTDLDEILEPNWGNVLRDNWIDGVHTRAVYKYTWSHLPNGQDGRIFMYNKIHSKEWEWKYPVHELLWSKVKNSENYTKDEELNLWDKIHLHHYPDQTKSRGSYLPLLELRAEEYKEDWYGLIYLAHEYYYRGFYQKSIDLLNKILTNYKDKYSVVEQASCYLFMGDSYRELEDEANAQASYLKAINTEPTYREPYLNLANSYIACKDFNMAEFMVKLALKKSFRHYTWLERDTSWTYEPYDILCLATYYGNKKKDSIAFAAKALSYEPDNERLKSNLKLCIDGSSDNDLM